MPGVIYSSEAERDLDQITEYIARDNVDAALRLIDQIAAACDLLPSQPECGERVESLRLGSLRRHVVGSYLIYYVALADGIGVVRNIHGARDQTDLV